MQEQQEQDIGRQKPATPARRAVQQFAVMLSGASSSELARLSVGPLPQRSYPLTRAVARLARRELALRLRPPVQC